MMKFIFKILIVIIIISNTKCESNKKTSTKNKLQNLKLSCSRNDIYLKGLDIKKIDTIYYEEGLIYNITNKDLGSIIFLCGYNVNLFDKSDIVLDSVKKEGKLILKGINNKTGLFWRKDGKLAYMRVKKKIRQDIIKYLTLKL